MPYLRDEETLARPWAIPGTAGLEHRIGGLEKGDGHGNISYDPANHDFMVRIRQAKVDRIADSLPPLEVDDPSGPAGQGRARCWCWAGGRRTARSEPACRRVRKAGFNVAQVHLRHLNPFPKDLGDILQRYDKVLVPEMNLGQLSMLLRARYLVDVVGYNEVRGLPLKAAELAAAIQEARSEGEGYRRTCTELLEELVTRMRSDVRATTQGRSVRSVEHRRTAIPRPGRRAQGRPAADRQGVHLGTGGALVPRLR